MTQHETLLDSYARLTVRTGLNIQKGQQLLITAPLDAVPLVRRITEHAYREGASLVTTFYADEATTLARFAHAPDEAFDTAQDWMFNGMAEAFRGGAARLAIAGEDPALLAGQDPGKLARANKARSRAYRPPGRNRCSRAFPNPRRWTGCGARSSPAPRPICLIRLQPGTGTTPIWRDAPIFSTGNATARSATRDLEPI
jgi:hypothetical protein